MAMSLNAAQLLLYRAAINAEQGLPSGYETAVAKAMCNKVGVDVANEAVQILGGVGYSSASLAEYCLRRTRGWMIAGGSIETMKNRIAERSVWSPLLAAAGAARPTPKVLAQRRKERVDRCCGFVLSVDYDVPRSQVRADAAAIARAGNGDG